MSYGIIYKVTNKINNKVYIGQTIKSLDERKRRHVYDAENHKDVNTTFYNAIRKYGIDNFEWIVLDTGMSKKDLDSKESYWIKELKSHIRDGKGYNMTTGGDGSEGFKHSKEARMKMSADRKGRKHTDEAKAKMSENRRGTNRTEEMKQKDREVKLGVYDNENNPRAKSVVKLTKDGLFVERFPTAKQGAESVNGKRSAISNCCNGESKTSYGFKWMFEEDYLALEK